MSEDEDKPFKVVVVEIIADLKNLNYDIPDISFLLNRLNNSLEVSKKKMFTLMVTLKGLNYEIDPNLWETFYINDYINFISNIETSNDNFYLILDEAIKKRNLAETVLITLNMLNELDTNKLNFYLLYKSLYALNEIGLREYARGFSLELNLGL